MARQTVNTFLARAIEEEMLVLLQDNSKARQPNRYRLLMPDSAPQMWSPKHGWDAPKDDVGHVAVDDMSHSAHVSVDDMHMSPETTPHVVRGDTNPIEPKVEPNPSMSAPPPASPSETRGSEGFGLDQDSIANDHEERYDDVEGEGTGSGKARDPDEDSSARELCDLLANKVEEHHGRRPKITDSKWVKDMDYLLRRGPVEWADPEPIDPAKIRMMIEYVYSYGTDSNNDFRWADQVKSPTALRKHWEKLRLWANREHQRRAKAKTEPTGAIDQPWMVRSNKS